MKKKTLVLCIDRDDDFGKKAKLRGPFLGEKDNLAAAQELAIKDPSESDVNAVYGAIRAYRELKKEGEAVEIATITGHRDRDHKADRHIVEQLEKILEAGDFKGIVLISDGADDNQVLPLIQSRVKILSVRTIIVKQAAELEKSYYVVKELLRDPHFSRLLFGLPGIVIGVYGLVNVLGIQQISLNLALGIIGGYLILKGFGLEDSLVSAFASFKKSTSIERASFPLYIGSFLLFLLSIWAGIDNIGYVWESVAAGVIIKTSYIFIVNLASFLVGFIGLFVLAAILFFAGRIGDMYYKGDFFRIKRYARSMVSMVVMFVIADAVARFALFWTNAISSGPSFADLFVAVGTGFIITLVGFLVIKYIYMNKYVKTKIRKGLLVKSSEGDPLGKVGSIDYKSSYFYYARGGEKVPVSFNKVFQIKGDEVSIV